MKKASVLKEVVPNLPIGALSVGGLEIDMLRNPGQIKAMVIAAFESENAKNQELVVLAACKVLKCSPENLGIAAQTAAAIAGVA